jgi:hypothetical protein
MDKSYVLPWINLMHQEMVAINNNKSDLRAYGGTNQAEIFQLLQSIFSLGLN